MDDVRQAQQQLSDLGYNPGDVNGMMSSDTQQAIREFQWFNGMPVSGNLDEATRMAIASQGGASSSQLSQTMPATGRRQTPGMMGGTSAKTEKDASERAMKAAEVLQDLTKASDRRIPTEILQRADAIAVIPHMMKGAFGVGGRYGKGLVSTRTANGAWSAPAFIEIGGGSFGAQLGVEATDLVLVFTNRDALNLLEKGRELKLGVDAGVAAGPIGRAGEAGVNANAKTAVYAYSRNKGLFAGVSLDGAVLNMDKSMNEKVYGPSADAMQILSGNVPPDASVQPFMTAIETVMPSKRISQR
jgi:lipid-binding SYLF domain-containing protein